MESEASPLYFNINHQPLRPRDLEIPPSTFKPQHLIGKLSLSVAGVGPNLQSCGNQPPQCSSHTVNSLVLLVSSGSRLLHSITMAWGIMMTQDTIHMMTMLLRALLAVLLNIRGWQMAYQRSRAMQLSVSTDTETEMVYGGKQTERMNHGTLLNSLRAAKMSVLNLALQKPLLEVFMHYTA